jgi:hypothetical protein
VIQQMVDALDHADELLGGNDTLVMNGAAAGRWLLEQPAVQEPVFCEYCGGNDDADFGLPTDHCTDCARPQPAAQPAPVPDATAEEWKDAAWKVWKLARTHNNTIPSHWLDRMRELVIAADPTAQPAVQEPVAWVNHGENRITRATGWDGYGALYTTPPAAQPAVPLTDDQIDQIIRTATRIDPGYVGWMRDQRRTWARAIEAAHGITAAAPEKGGAA